LTAATAFIAPICAVVMSFNALRDRRDYRQSLRLAATDAERKALEETKPAPVIGPLAMVLLAVGFVAASISSSTTKRMLSQGAAAVCNPACPSNEKCIDGVCTRTANACKPVSDTTPVWEISSDGRNPFDALRIRQGITPR